MSKIELRDYLQIIESLLAIDKIEDAISHCLHILSFIPKNIEVYKILGRTYLEQQNYNKGFDILIRVLSVYPDDFVSHIGMSIIFEDRDNLNSSIFHMERAHEIQPASRIIRDELRRLFEIRDGIYPTKMIITRGALIRLYLKGELFKQAASEALNCLSEEPGRMDIYILLARSYKFAGLFTETEKICRNITSKLPYCIEANQYLLDILPVTSSEEDINIIKNRIIEIDPYGLVNANNRFTTDKEIDNRIFIEDIDTKQSNIIISENTEIIQNIDLVNLSPNIIIDTSKLLLNENVSEPESDVQTNEFNSSSQILSSEYPILDVLISSEKQGISMASNDEGYQPEIINSEKLGEEFVTNNTNDIANDEHLLSIQIEQIRTNEDNSNGQTPMTVDDGSNIWYMKGDWLPIPNSHPETLDADKSIDTNQNSPKQTSSQEVISRSEFAEPQAGDNYLNKNNDHIEFLNEKNEIEPLAD